MPNTLLSQTVSNADIKTAKRILLDPVYYYGSIMLLQAIELLGVECLKYDPHTINLELNDILEAEQPPRAFDRMMSALHIAADDRFFSDPMVFNVLCQSINGEWISNVDRDGYSVVDISSPDQCAWGITESLLIRRVVPGVEDREPEFSDDVRSFLGHLLDDYSILYPPDVLRIAIRSKSPEEMRASYSYLSESDPDLYAAMSQLHDERSAELREVIDNGLRNWRNQRSLLTNRH